MATTSTHKDITGPAGRIETAIDAPDGAARGVAVLCHPHPVHGGTMDNKVIQTLARAFLQLGYRAVRFNFRGVGQSQGQWDHGAGEVDDALAVVAACRATSRPRPRSGWPRPMRRRSVWCWSARPPPPSRCLRCLLIRWSFTARPMTWCR
jgi:uncharacterized protein